MTCPNSNTLHQWQTPGLRVTHGENRRHRVTVEYRAFYAAKNRCDNEKTPDFLRYGGRGIEFRFTSFPQFLACVGRRPSPKYSLDRIDNEGHYEPGNVEWSLKYQQTRNTRANHWITVNGETKVLSDWPVDARLIDARIRKFGWCESCAATILPRKGVCSHR